MPDYRPAGYVSLDIEVKAYLGVARVTGSTERAGCLVLDVSDMTDAETFSLGGVLEGKGGMNLRKEPPHGKAKWLVVHGAAKPAAHESAEEE